MGAVRFKEEKVSYRPDRCIGCGLCVTTCPSGARTLGKKVDNLLYTPPETVAETFKGMSEERD